MKKKFLEFFRIIEEKNGIAMFILGFIGIILTILTSIFGGKIAGIIIGVLLLIIFVYHFFWENIIKFYNLNIKVFGKTKITIFCILIVLFSLGLFYFLSGNSKPKIFNITKGFDLKFEEVFDGDNLVGDKKFQWIYEDENNEFTTTEKGTKTLKSSAYLQRGYGMFQNLKDLKGEKILVGKFNLKEGGKIGIRFMNTINFESDEIRSKHNNECILQNYQKGKIYKGYGHHITKNKFLWKESSFEKTKLENGEYYILAKLSGRNFSCYYQKVGTDKVIEIIKNKKIIFENLGGPALTKFIDDKKTYPEILEFKLYTKTN